MSMLRSMGKPSRGSARRTKLTSHTVLERHPEQKHEDMEEALLVSEAAVRKEAEQDETWRRCEAAVDSGNQYSGSLQDKSKADLEVIAAVLKLSVSGKKDRLITAIEDVILPHPKHQSNMRFAGLYNGQVHVGRHFLCAS